MRLILNRNIAISYLIIAFYACNSDKTSPPPPPIPERPKLDCPIIKTYCEPDYSADYQHIIRSFTERQMAFYMREKK